MMTLHQMDQLLQRAAKLTLSERLLLASRLIQSVRNEMSSRQPRLKWSDAAGLLQYPALGEDAQTYITHSRHTDDDHSTKIIRDGE
jgi:hypothetical protein